MLASWQQKGCPVVWGMCWVQGQDKRQGYADELRKICPFFLDRGLLIYHRRYLSMQWERTYSLPVWRKRLERTGVQGGMTGCGHPSRERREKRSTFKNRKNPFNNLVKHFCSIWGQILAGQAEFSSTAWMAASLLPHQLFDILGLDKFEFWWFNYATIRKLVTHSDFMSFTWLFSEGFKCIEFSIWP